MKDYRIASAPTISPEVFARALANRRSPVVRESRTAYEICARRGVNPAVALGLFVHESNCGTAGIARFTKSWGNLRFGRRAVRRHLGFAWYADWLEGLRDYCDLVRGPLYEGAGLLTVSTVLPRYAPAADRNNPTRYAQIVNRLCAVWERMSGTMGTLGTLDTEGSRQA